MLSKLIKHEWRAFWKIPAFVNLFLVIFTAFGVIALNAKIWESESIIIQSLSVFVLLFYYIALIVISFTVVLYTALRFYKNIYTDEGYLMHTLPVTQKSLIVSKLIVSYAWTLITFLVIIVSILSLLAALLSSTGAAGDFWESLNQLIAELQNPAVLALFKETFGIGLLPFLILVLIYFLISPLYNALTLYASVSLGQLFKKHKIFGSIISYIGIYTVLQIINSIVTIPAMITSDTAMMVSESATFTYLPSTLYFLCAENIVVMIIFFFLTEWIMKKKLNLD